MKVLIIAILAASISFSSAARSVLMGGKGRLAIVDAEGRIEWEMRWGAVHDIHLLENGNILTQRMPNKVVEIDRKTKKIVWQYDAGKSNGNAGKRIEVHAIQALPGGRIMVAESGSGRIIEIDRSGKIHREIKLKCNMPSAHSDTRLARKLRSGNYLVCHEADGFCREYDSSGKVVWEYEVPMFGKSPKGGHGLDAFGNKLFGAVRLENGNTLIATGNGHSVIEVTPGKEVVWQIEQDTYKDQGIRLAWVTTLEVLPNGNYVIGNCHAGADNPLLIEVNPKTKKVEWEFKRFDLFGNSAPNSLLVNLAGKTNR
ncbi:MAG: PQQ-binding-like beta-propeller repeat protein [Verrucomicrobiales bacterium]